MTRRDRLRLLEIAVAVLAGVAAAGAAWLMPRRSLDALLAVLFASALLGPQVTAGRTWLALPAVAVTAIAGIAFIERPSLSYLALLTGWLVAIIGLASTVQRRSSLAGVWPMLVSFVGIAWLAWPIWLAPQLVAWQVEPPRLAVGLHPLFATNAAELGRGIWTEQPNAYALTPLGQDLAYALPSSAWPAAACHGVIGCVCIALAVFRDRRRRRRRSRSTDEFASSDQTTSRATT